MQQCQAAMAYSSMEAVIRDHPAQEVEEGQELAAVAVLVLCLSPCSFWSGCAALSEGSVLDSAFDRSLPKEDVEVRSNRVSLRPISFCPGSSWGTQCNLPMPYHIGRRTKHFCSSSFSSCHTSILHCLDAAMTLLFESAEGSANPSSDVDVGYEKPGVVGLVQVE